MIVVVAGRSRKVGKTTAMCALIAASAQSGWTAVKISPHPHDQAIVGDTGRYLAAGAQQAFLLHSSEELPQAENLIIESNSILERVQPDLLYFVAGDPMGEWKDSAQGLMERADAVVGVQGITPFQIGLLRKLLRDR